MTTPMPSDAINTPPAQTAEPVVVFDDVLHYLRHQPVLHHISFTVQRGETRIILGPAGCGKSVLMKLANGLMQPDLRFHSDFRAGDHHHAEYDMFKLRARIGMVFQESALFDSLSVEENVAYRLTKITCRRMKLMRAFRRLKFRRTGTGYQQVSA